MSGPAAVTNSCRVMTTSSTGAGAAAQAAAFPGHLSTFYYHYVAMGRQGAGWPVFDRLPLEVMAAGQLNS